jgi:hypothetical protein
LLAMQMQKQGGVGSARNTAAMREGNAPRHAARTSAPTRSRPYSSSSSSPAKRPIYPASSLRNKSPQGRSWEEWTPKKASKSNESQKRARALRPPLSTNGKAQYDERPTTRSKKPITRNRTATSDPSPSRASKQRRKELHGDPSARAVPPQVDSTLFFPVGTSVVHSVHGKGKVLPPPEGAVGGNMLVRVEFESGIEMELPVGAGLRHQF